MSAFPIVESAGAPFELGRSYGAAAGEAARRAVELYAGWFARSGVSEAQLAEAGAGVLAALAAALPALAEELRGAAAGAGLSAELLAALNARSELLSAWAPGALAECTSVGLEPAATAPARPLLAQTWDWFRPVAQVALLRRARPEGAPAFVTFCEAGQLAKIGLNAAGLALGLNFLELPLSEHAAARRGVPVHLLARALLGCRSVAEALALLEATPRGGACNLVLADATGAVVDVEVTPSRLVRLRPERGVVAHANSFEGPTPSGRPGAPPPFRSRRMRELALARRGRLDVASLGALLRDHQLGAGMICEHGAPGEDADWVVAASLAALVLAPAGDADDPRPALWVSRGPPCQHALERVEVG